MANAKQCDRCDKFYKPYDGIGIDKVKIDPINSYIGVTLDAKEKHCGKVMDLCPECMRKLIDFLFYKDSNDENEEGKDDI